MKVLLQTPACERCTHTNPHLLGTCSCPCHEEEPGGPFEEYASSPREAHPAHGSSLDDRRAG
jgi:hypothetical protein